MRPQTLIRTVRTCFTPVRLQIFRQVLFAHTNTMSGEHRPKVFVTRKVPDDGVILLRRFYEVTQWDSEETIPRNELLECVKGIDALFCLLTDKIDAEVLNAAGPTLKAVSTMSVGYDHVDVTECARRGLPVGFTPDVLTSATAELTVALLLATSRRLKEGMRAVVDGTWGTWNPIWLLGPGLDGAVVGIIGLGRIGFAVAQRLKPFGVKEILYSEPEEKDYASQIPAQFCSMDTLLQKSDFVLGCCALTEANTGLINKEAFSIPSKPRPAQPENSTYHRCLYCGSLRHTEKLCGCLRESQHMDQKMKKTAVFVNTSRGGLVNQVDLYEALSSVEITAAGLDVTTPEPLPTDHPLLTLDNCVVLPHIASATTKARSAMSELCAQNIIEALNGRPMPAQVK